MKPSVGFIPRGDMYDPDNVDAVEAAIIKKFDEIVAMADAGIPPVTAIVPDLQKMIYEGAYWRLADLSIGHALSPKFERVKRIRFYQALLPLAAIYVRSKP